MNGSGTLNGSRQPPNPPGGHHDPSYDTALKGASLAFQKTTPKKLPASSPSSRHVDTRALIAATSAASASRDHSRTVSRQTTGSNSNQGGGSSHDVEHSQHLIQRLQPLAQRSYGTPSYSHSHTHSHLSPRGKQISVDPHSPSFIAASLAASRNPSPIRHQTRQSPQYSRPPAKSRRKYYAGANESAASSVTSLDLATDTTSIPSTNTLISMFEKEQDNTDPVKKGHEAPGGRKSLGAEIKPRARSPPRVLDSIAKNELSPSRLASAIAWERGGSPSASEGEIIQERSKQPKHAAWDLKRRPPTPPPTRTKHDVKTPEHTRALEPKGKQRASTPPPRTTTLTDSVVLSPGLSRPASEKTMLNDVRAQDIIAAKDEELQSTRPAPEDPAPIHDTRESPTPPSRIYQSSPSPNGSFVSASSSLLSSFDSPIRGRSRPMSPDPDSPETTRPRRPTAQYRPLSTYSLSTTSSALPGRLRYTPTSSLSVDSLASAMVASSLASSRVTPSQASLASLSSRTPPHVPAPHMRQTLRKPMAKREDEDGSRSRSKQRRRKPLGKLGGGKKHIHHEGARKRWREEITARERKRYEGVWASNRGLLLASPSSSDPVAHPHTDNTYFNSHPHAHPPRQQQQPATKRQQDKHREAEKANEQLVVNVVVRDIWARSRLPFDELAEVWELVDRKGVGALDRAEFVVGMWLIDQRLRGRKIPQKVGESVWGSARGVRVGSLRGRR
ncbi:hypothetical protein GGR53DRAFT_27010 [Hypoxylon sp. FL1150]|nr:hypothetical protein GGR53DRAFT_27010 [Hypoxylon sp. FL1150]